MAEKTRLAGGPEKTVTWIWFEDGQFKVEFYDFSDLAQQVFGNDIAYTLTVQDISKLFSVTAQNEGWLMSWIAERFTSYFDIKRWLEEKEVEFSVEIDSRA
jgi:hypothetical protein